MARRGEKRTRSWRLRFPGSSPESIVERAIVGEKIARDTDSAGPEQQGMSHTFVIRFERAAGLAGLLAAPQNSFRWKGAGTIRIEREGIRFAVKRGLLWLFPHERRVAAAHLEEVYREGDALRLTFTDADSARSTVACWAEDADTAGKIVELLPTRRTVELEHSTRAAQAPRERYDWRALVLLLLVAIGLAGGAWWWIGRTPVAPVITPAPIVVPTVLAPPVVATPLIDGVRPIPKDSVYYAVASHQLELFEKESAALLTDYQVDRELLETGAMKWETFAERLGILEARWWTVSYRILDDAEFSALPLADLRATLLASARQWRVFLQRYAQGLQEWNPGLVYESFRELDRAEKLQMRARRYLE